MHSEEITIDLGPSVVRALCGVVVYIRHQMVHELSECACLCVSNWTVLYTTHICFIHQACIDAVINSVSSRFIALGGMQGEREGAGFCHYQR